MGLRAKHPFFWFVLIYGGLVTAVFIFVGILTYRYGSLSLDLGWSYECKQDQCTVTEVNSQGPASDKLRRGDQIVAVNHNRQFARVGVWAESLLPLEPIHSFTLTVKRGASETDVDLHASYYRDYHRLFAIIILFVAAFISLECAIWIGALKPELRTTQLFALTWMFGSLVQVLPAMKLMQPFFGPTELQFVSLIWLLAVSPMPIATGFHFCYRFPPGIPESHGWTIVKNVLYIWIVSLTLFFTFTRFFLVTVPLQGTQFIFEYHRLFAALERIMPIENIIVLPLISAVLARNYRLLRDPDLRRRLRWVVYGSIAGTLPFVIYSFIAYFDRTANPGSTVSLAHDKLFLIANFALVLLPVTSAYAIVKNRMFDIRVIVRKGVRYLFARKILQVLIYAPLIVIFVALRAHRDQPILEVLFSNSAYILIVAAALAGLLFRKNLLEGLDRKFFREAYDSERILLNLTDEIKNFTSMSEVAEWVSSQLKSALHPKEIYVHYRQKERSGGLTLGYSSSDKSEVQYIADGTEWLRILELEGKSQNFISSDQHALPQEEVEWLRTLQIHLVVPMLGSDQRLKGVLLLGEKRSEEPYSTGDRRLLEALAGQMAIMHENLLLKEKVDEGDRVQRDVLAHLASEKRNLMKECPTCGTCFDSSANLCNQDGSELILTLPVERTIGGKYLLNSLLGKGGMGAVYRATDLRLAREIALKIMMGSMFGNTHAVRRFEREARASARLQHPNIITIYDFGGIGEGAYLAMELLEGYTLRSTLEQSGNLSPTLAAQWFDQILDGVKAAHQLGVIHRDLKPENVFITKGQKNRSVLKILDFGLAKVKAVDAPKSATLTAPGTAMGTLHYMSPEQIVAGEIDERTDIFSLGVMVIEALTGNMPFDGKNATDLALAILRKEFHLPGDSPEVKQLDAVLQKCIAKNKGERYSSISEMQKYLIEAIARVTAFPATKPASDSTQTDSFYL